MLTFQLILDSYVFIPSTFILINFPHFESMNTDGKAACVAALYSHRGATLFQHIIKIIIEFNQLKPINIQLLDFSTELNYKLATTITNASKQMNSTQPMNFQSMGFDTFTSTFLWFRMIPFIPILCALI